MKKSVLAGLLVAIGLVVSQVVLSPPALASDKALSVSDSNPVGGGTWLKATASQGAKTVAGSTAKWSGVQATAELTGTVRVMKAGESYKTTAEFFTAASLRSGANMSGGFGVGTSNGANAGGGSTWIFTKTTTRSLSQANSRKVQTPASNAAVTPAKDYRDGTFSVQVTAKVKLSWDTWTYTAVTGK